MGYAVPIEPMEAPLPLPPQIPSNPAQVMAKIVYPQAIDTSEYPDLEDFSILEPEVILQERPGVLLITEKPMKQNGGTRQVMVNGKLMTLMPYQTINNQKIGRFCKFFNFSHCVIKYFIFFYS